MGRAGTIRLPASGLALPGLSRETFDAVLQMLADGFSTRIGRRAAYLHRDRINGRLRW